MTQYKHIWGRMGLLLVLFFTLAACFGGDDEQTEDPQPPVENTVQAIVPTATLAESNGENAPAPVATNQPGSPDLDDITPPPPDLVTEPDESAPIQPEPVAEQPASTAPQILPSRLYYIGNTGQIMRLDRDGATIAQMTGEASRITDFDVSAENDFLVYVSDNQLIKVGLSTGQRSVLLVGEFSEGSFELRAKNAIMSPRISPDGGTIAFVQDGIKLINSQGDPVVTTLVPNSPFPEDGVAIEGPLRFFFTVGWSPDGSKLDTSFNYFPEGGNVGIVDLATGTLTDLRGENAPTCCQLVWSQGGEVGAIGSNQFVYNVTGLSRIEPAQGQVTSVLQQTQENTTVFVQGPFPQPDGTIFAFVAESTSFQDANLNYRLQRFSADNSANGDILPRSFFLNRGVLWSPDGNSVVVSERNFLQNPGATGRYRWISLATNELLELPIIGEKLSWESAANPPEVAGALNTLTTQAAEELGNGALGVQDIFVRRLLSPDRELWVAHTIGARGITPSATHRLGIYTWSGGWQLLAQTELTDEQSVFGPDFLVAGNVEQAFIDPNNLWLTVNSGLGVHGGLFQVLRFDGGALQVVGVNINGSPSAGWVEDLNEDGRQEVVFDRTDPYVFSYAAGVRNVNLQVLGWDGANLTEIGLTVVDASVAPNGADALNAAVQLANGGLWQAALERTRDFPAPESDGARWVEILISLNATARSRLTNSAYPLVSYMLAGAYPQATSSPFDGLEIEEIFNRNGPLIVGTVVENNVVGLSQLINQTTNDALAADPNVAGAYFLRGWINYIQNPNNQAAIADIVRAAEIRPNHFMFPSAAEFVQSGQ